MGEMIDTRETTLWRRSKVEARLLCNACGTYERVRTRDSAKKKNIFRACFLNLHVDTQLHDSPRPSGICERTTHRTRRRTRAPGTIDNRNMGNVLLHRPQEGLDKKHLPPSARRLISRQPAPPKHVGHEYYMYPPRDAAIHDHYCPCYSCHRVRESRGYMHRGYPGQSPRYGDGYRPPMHPIRAGEWYQGEGGSAPVFFPYPYHPQRPPPPHAYVYGGGAIPS